MIENTSFAVPGNYFGIALSLVTDQSKSSHAHKTLSGLTHLPTDGHNDFPYMIRGFYGNNLDDGALQDTPMGQTDLTRLRQGQLGGQFWSAYVPWYVTMLDPSRQL